MKITQNPPTILINFLSRRRPLLRMEYRNNFNLFVTMPDGRSVFDKNGHTLCFNVDHPETTSIKQLKADIAAFAEKNGVVIKTEVLFILSPFTACACIGCIGLLTGNCSKRR